MKTNFAFVIGSTKYSIMSMQLYASSPSIIYTITLSLGSCTKYVFYVLWSNNCYKSLWDFDILLLLLSLFSYMCPSIQHKALHKTTHPPVMPHTPLNFASWSKIIKVPITTVIAAKMIAMQPEHFWTISQMRPLSTRASLLCVRTDKGFDWLKEAKNHNGHSHGSMAKYSISIITFDYFKIM